MSAAVGTIFFLGNTIGNLVAGVFVDARGRRTGLLVGTGMSAIVLPATFLCVGPISLSCVRFVSGIACGFAMGVIVYVLEFAPASRRMLTKAMLTTCGWSWFLILVIGLAYAVDGTPWRALVVCTLPAVAAFPVCAWILPESPRFLMSSGRENAALECLHRIATTNQRPLPPDVTLDRAEGATLIDDGAHGHSPPPPSQLAQPSQLPQPAQPLPPVPAPAPLPLPSAPLPTPLPLAPPTRRTPVLRLCQLFDPRLRTTTALVCTAFFIGWGLRKSLAIWL